MEREELSEGQICEWHVDGYCILVRIQKFTETGYVQVVPLSGLPEKWAQLIQFLAITEELEQEIKQIVI